MENNKSVKNINFGDFVHEPGWRLPKKGKRQNFGVLVNSENCFYTKKIYHSNENK